MRRAFNESTESDVRPKGIRTFQRVTKEKDRTAADIRREKGYTRRELEKGKVMQFNTDVLHLQNHHPIFLPKRHCRIARAAAIAGVASVAALARLCNVSDNTCARWLMQYKEFRQAWEQALDIKAIEIEAALAKRAMGYDVKQVVKRKEIDPMTGTRKVVERRTLHVPGDVAAQKFFLENRRTKRWTKSKGVPTKSMSLNITVDASDKDI